MASHVRDLPRNATSTSPHFAKTNILVRHITSRSNNPYLILGVPPSSSFRTVQKAFAKLAFEHHPDTKNDNDTSRTNRATISKDFIRIREAFERIRDAKQSGKPLSMVDEATSVSSTTRSHSWTENDFLYYFHRQTGVMLTSEQRQELVNLYRTRVKGSYYGGHSWDLARRLVAEQDAFLRNMHGGGPSRRGTTGASGASFRAGAPEGDVSGASNLRRKRKR